MSSPELMSLDEFRKRTSLSARQVIYACEKLLIKPAEDRGGRGHHRGFSEENVVEYRLGQLLINNGLELRQVASVLALVRSFFEQARKRASDGPSTMPRSLAEASDEKPAWLYVLDFAAVMLSFRDATGNTHYTDFVRVLAGGGFSGSFHGDQQTIDGATTVLRIDLAKLPR